MNKLKKYYSSNAECIRIIRFAIVVSLFLMMSAEIQSAERKDEPFEFGKRRVSANGLLISGDAYMWDLDWHYMINHNFGFGAGFGMWQNYFSNGCAKGPGWKVGDNRPGNVFIRISVLAKSPSLIFWNARWGLQAEPAVTFGLPQNNIEIEKTDGLAITGYDYVKNSKGQWVTTELRAGIFSNFGRLGVSAGYLISSLDIYSKFRHSSYQGISFRNFYPRISPTQGAYLSIAYYY